MRFNVPIPLNSFFRKGSQLCRGILFYFCLNANQNVLKRFLCLGDPSTAHDAIYSIKGVCALNGNPLLRYFQ